MEHGLSDKMSLSNGQEIGFSLEHIALMLTMKGLSKRPVSAMVVARIERTLAAREASK